MIVDTSAIVAILFGEPEAERFGRAISQAPHCRMSVANLVETGIVVEGRAGEANGRDLDLFLESAGIVLEPVTPDHAQRARRAWRRFGKGNHPAGLNFGDCFAYALAEATREPLLFKGEDCALTDIDAA